MIKHTIKLNKIVPFHHLFICSRIVIGGLFLLLFVSALPGQKSSSFRAIPMEDGLTQSSVLALAQDSMGFLWVGTKDGLNRFDGYEFINYKYNPNNENSITNNEISSLEVEGEHYLWIGTRSGGLNRLDLSTGNIIRHSNLTYDDLIRDIHFDSQDNLWVGTSEGLFLFYRDKDGERTQFVNKSTNSVYRHETNEPFIPSKINISIVSLFELKPGKLLAGAEEGLFEYDIERNEFKSLTPMTLDVTVFTSLLKDGNGNIWAGSYDGLLKLAPRRKDSGYDVTVFDSSQTGAQKLPVNWVEQIIKDHHGNIWVGTRGGGLTLVTKDTVVPASQFTNDDSEILPDIIINSLLIDRTGVLWVGTESKGLVYRDLFAMQFYCMLPATPNRDGLSDNLATAITGSNNKLWVGTARSGIDILDIQGDRILTKGNIPRIYLSPDLWKSEIVSLLYDEGEDALWIGSSTNSLVRYTEKTGFERYVVNGFVISLFNDKRGNIWFGTWGQGVGFINKHSRKIQQYNQRLENGSLGLSSDIILSVFVDSNDYLWLGSKGGGVCVAHIDDVINRTGNFHIFKHIPGEDNSLSYNDVYSISESRDGSIWLATGSGLNKLEIPEGIDFKQALIEKKIEFSHITEKSGLTGGLVYSIQEDEKGNIWLGTNKGLSRYSPSQNSIISYRTKDGLASESFHLNASFKQKDGGLMLFGGADGITYFFPDSIIPNPYPVMVSITGLRIHNRLVLPGEKVKGRIILDKSISYSDNIELAFRDNEITFEFAALHFSSPAKNRYKYRMIGFNNKWQETGSNNRRATYTNLRPGNYIFQVTATNNDGIPNEIITQLNVIINPPMWRTTWAYIFYLLLFTFLLWVFRKYSLIGVKKKSKLLIESLEHKKEIEIAEAKMRFFTNISHEIRTPLTLINAPLQQLLQREHSPETQVALLMIQRNVKRLLTQVNQLLEFRRLEKGSTDLFLSHFSLETLIKEIIPSFESLGKQKNIDIQLIKKGDGFVHVDRNLMATVIYNLISNSLKFTPEKGKLTIEIEAKPKLNQGDPIPSKGEEVLLKVSDTGPGIPEKEMENIFQRFYQLDDKRHEHLAGSGIGLSIVKEFVEKCGGSIIVYNLPKNGCCFEVSLPVGLPNEDNNDQSITPVLLQPVLESDYKPINQNVANVQSHLKVFIVEDDVELAAYLKSFFDENYETYYAHDGVKALEMVGELNPDIMICDVMLPGINGIELCRQIKTSESTSHIPVIMLSAKTEEETIVDGLTSGANSYLIKPFNINVLAAQVSTVLKSREIFRLRFSKQFILEPTETTLTPLDKKFINKLIEIIESNMSDTAFDVPHVIDAMNMSHSIILKKVKSLTGLTLVEFIRSMRIKKAAQIFRQDKLSVAEVGYMVGFSDPKYFSKCFAREMGKKPTDYLHELYG
jgi:signal transduction histidine kinase/ligand-binding sensor domain-containing protein/DNA-binding response OmpR family regulator